MRYIYDSIIILFLFLTGCSKQKDNWFVTKKIDDRTYILSEPHSSQGNSVFLIMGDKEALLFDSGTGENKSENIVQVVQSLTNQPVTLLLSHFHFDHIGNVDDFSRIGIPEIQMLTNRLSADNLICLSPKETLTGDTVIMKISRVFPMETEIDLGKRKIKILPTPGHSKESISIIDNENGYIFTGDLIYNGLLLLNDCNAYIKSISKIIENSHSNYRVFGSHGKPEVKYEKLARVKKAINSYCKDSSSFKPVSKINFLGSSKNVYEIDNILFVNGYTDAFSQ